jgi:hypothetical protein
VDVQYSLADGIIQSSFHLRSPFNQLTHPSPSRLSLKSKQKQHAAILIRIDATSRSLLDDDHEHLSSDGWWKRWWRDEGLQRRRRRDGRLSWRGRVRGNGWLSWWSFPRREVERREGTLRDGRILWDGRIWGILRQRLPPP